MTINGQQPAFALGQIVYLVTDQEQQRRIVTAYKVTDKETIFELSMGETAGYFYEMEISCDKDILLSI